MTFAGVAQFPALKPSRQRFICSFSLGTMQSQAAAGGFNGSSEHP